MRRDQAIGTLALRVFGWKVLCLRGQAAVSGLRLEEPEGHLPFEVIWPGSFH